MKFIHITDIHLVRDGEPVNGGIPSERFDACLRDVALWHGDAEFCVITGDLAEFAQAEAYEVLRARLADFPIPCFLLIGNHDDRGAFLSVFPDHPRDANGFIQHGYENDTGVFVFLDSTIDGRDEHAGALCADRLAWLRAALVAAGERPCYVFLHHPPFAISIPEVDDIRLFGADDFAEALGHARNLRHVFYGHVHRSTYVNWRGIPFTSLPSLNHQSPLVAASVDGEFSDEPPAYGVVEIGADQLTVHFNNYLPRKGLEQTPRPAG